MAIEAGQGQDLNLAFSITSPVTTIHFVRKSSMSWIKATKVWKCPYKEGLWLFWYFRSVLLFYMHFWPFWKIFGWKALCPSQVETKGNGNNHSIRDRKRLALLLTSCSSLTQSKTRAKGRFQVASYYLHYATEPMKYFYYEGQTFALLLFNPKIVYQKEYYDFKDDWICECCLWSD